MEKPHWSPTLCGSVATPALVLCIGGGERSPTVLLWQATLACGWTVAAWGGSFNQLRQPRKPG